MNDPYVVSVILNTNRREDTLECLTSLQANSYPNHKAIVLDNHSGDGSVEAIRSAFPQVQVVELEQNLGYAGNNNVGIEEALKQGADWVFVLNEDTILDPECVSILIDVAESDPSIGVVGPMVFHFDEPNIIQSAGGMLNRYWDSWHIFQNETDNGQIIEPHSVDFISGCAIMVREKVIREVGMIDARFFYYKEETEWCFRIRENGWRIVHIPSAKIWHKGVQRNYQPKPYVTYYKTRNMFLLLSKHRAPLLVWIGAWTQTIRTIMSWSIKPKWRSKREHRNAMLLGIRDFMLKRWGQMRT